MEPDNAIYGRSLVRNLYELHRSLSYRNAYNGLYAVVPATDWSFFSYASLAFFDGIFAHAIKVLDRHKDAASFFYLYNCNRKEVLAELAKSHLNLVDVQTLSSKLNKIRDKTHFHIDKKAVFSPNAVWLDADMTGNFFNNVMDKLWLVLNSLHASYFHREFGQPIYAAKDVKAIIEAVQSKGLRV